MTIDPSLFKEEKFNNGKKIHCLLSSFSSVPNAIVILEKLNLQSWMFLAAGIGTEVSLGTVGKKSFVACTQLQMHLLNQLCSPYPNNCMSVAAHSSVPCHPASLEPHVLSKICINQFCAWCSLSAGQSRRLCMVQSIPFVWFICASRISLHHGKPDVLYPCSPPIPHKSVCLLPEGKSWNN